MRCAKLIRSLVLGENIHDPLLLYQHRHRHDNSNFEEETDEDDDHDRCRSHSCLFFLPTHETIHDTRKLAAIARDMGMNFAPDPSLTHILFSWPASPPPPPSSSLSLTSPPPITSTTTIPLPFPCLSSASASHLHRFARISKGLFTLVTCCCCNNACSLQQAPEAAAVSSSGLFSRLSGEKIQDMEGLARALTGNGWALFKTTTTTLDGDRRGDFFVFRKVERDGVKGRRWLQGWYKEEDEEEYCRVREVRLPWLDFGQVVPTRILHYILLMTDDLFYLA